MNAYDPKFALSREMEAAKVLREQLADLVAGDPEFIRDTIEGETNLREQIAAMVASIAEDEALAEGVKRLQDTLTTRRERYEARAETKRTLVANAMAIGEIKKQETPAGTVSLKALPPKLHVTEEADIPTRFWKPADPKLDRKALTDALKDRDAAIGAAEAVEDADERARAIAKANEDFPPITGAVLTNGSSTIAIRK